MTLLKKISNMFRKKEESFSIVDTDIHVLKSEFNNSEYIMEGTMQQMLWRLQFAMPIQVE